MYQFFSYSEARNYTIKRFAPEILATSLGIYCGYKYILPTLNNQLTNLTNAAFNQAKKLSLLSL